MRTNLTKQKLQNGEKTLGCWLTLGSARAYRKMAADGTFDWLMIDTEHNPMDRETVAACILNIAEGSGGRVAPMVRVPDLAPANIKHALDAGAYGILAPMITSVQDVVTFVEGCRYPPAGMRGVYGSPGAHITFATTLPEYFRGANSQIMVAVQIETRPALQAVDEIAAVDGVDMLFVGPGDLHVALGMMPQNDSAEPTFLAALDTVLAACRKHGKAAGILCMEVETARRRLAQGFQFVGVGNDIGHLMNGAKAALAATRAG